MRRIGIRRLDGLGHRSLQLPGQQRQCAGGECRGGAAAPGAQVRSGRARECRDARCCCPSGSATDTTRATPARRGRPLGAGTARAGRAASTRRSRPPWWRSRWAMPSGCCPPSENRTAPHDRVSASATAAVRITRVGTAPQPATRIRPRNSPATGLVSAQAAHNRDPTSTHRRVNATSARSATAVPSANVSRPMNRSPTAAVANQTPTSDADPGRNRRSQILDAQHRYRDRQQTHRA